MRLSKEQQSAARVKAPKVVGGERNCKIAAMAQAHDFYKKRGKLMYVLRQTYECGWCPLTVVTRTIGLDGYQEILKWERQAHASEKRLDWNSRAVRALTPEERHTMRQEAAEAMAAAEIEAEAERQEAEANRVYSAQKALCGPNRLTGTDVPSYQCESAEPTASSSKEPLYKVDVESDDNSTVSDNVSVAVMGNDDEDCKIVSESLARLKPRKTWVDPEPVATWKQKNTEPEFELESLAPLKRRRQSD